MNKLNYELGVADSLHGNVKAYAAGSHNHAKKHESCYFDGKNQCNKKEMDAKEITGPTTHHKKKITNAIKFRLPE